MDLNKAVTANKTEIDDIERKHYNILSHQGRRFQFKKPPCPLALLNL